jgi:hypothetical protein
MTSSEAARTIARRIPGVLVGGLLVVIAAIAAALLSHQGECARAAGVRGINTREEKP